MSFWTGNFWFGLVIGLLLGANIGLVVTGMLFTSKTREEGSQRAIVSRIQAKL